MTRTRFLRPLAALVAAVGGSLLAPVTEVEARQPDPRAIEVARATLDAIEREWAIGAYDAAFALRASFDLSGESTSVTGELVVDRRNGRLRLDTERGVGPLTFVLAGGSGDLHVPSLGQYATRSTGALGAGLAGFSARSRIETARQRLGGEYGALSHLGVETVDGAETDRIRDVTQPGTTVDYWIDQRTRLPRRIVVAEGERRTRIGFRYASGPRPSGAVIETGGPRPVRITLAPVYDGSGRAASLRATIAPATGSPMAADVRLDWDPSIAPGFFEPVPPGGAKRVPFQQLVWGVLFSAAGQLGPLLPLVTGGF